MRRLLASIINSHIWIGACASASYLYTLSMVPGVDFSVYTALFIWASTTFLYTILQDLKTGINKGQFLKLLICLVIMMITIPKAFSTLGVLLLIPTALISVLYGVRLKGLKWGLRAVPYVKIYLIGFVWVVVTSLIPIIDSGILWTSSIWLFLFSQLLYLLAVTLPFDIRDLIHDSPAMKTLPQLIGFKSSKMLSSLLILLSTALAVLFCHYELRLFLVIPVLLIGVLSLIIIQLVKPNSPRLYFTGIIDGLLFIQGVIVWVFAETLA